MKTDNILCLEGMEVLITTLGPVDMERFISMVKRDTFDYTEWQTTLWDGNSIEEIHEMATEYERHGGVTPPKTTPQG